MSTFVLLVLVAVGSEQSAAEERPDPRRFAEISEDMRTVLRAEATAKTQTQRGAAVRQLAKLYREILQDPRLETSDTLKSYKSKIWSRLTRIKSDLQREIDRDKKQRENDGTEIDEVALKQATQSLAAQMELDELHIGRTRQCLFPFGRFVWRTSRQRPRTRAD